jgi:hypothetical protein
VGSDHRQHIAFEWPVEGIHVERRAERPYLGLEYAAPKDPDDDRSE